MKNIISWSGGKDSTATIVLAREHGIKIDEIIISLPWFDRKEKIYADHPDHVAWVLEYAKPLFESWGYHVKVLSDERDYLYWFYKTVTKSKLPERNGLYYGFVIAGMCKMNVSKIEPIKRYIRSLEYPITMYEGIASDETDRLKGMHKNRNHLSLLEKYGVNESETYEILRPYNLLSPIYKTRRRQGCWFCPSQNAAEAADFKLHYPHIWSLLNPLAEITSSGTTNAKCFRYNKTFEEFEKEADEYIKNPPPIQLTMFDMMNSLVID